MNAPFRETNPAELAAIERWRARETATPLRSYAGEQGPPFRYPAPDALPTGEDRGMWLFLGGMGWGVLCSILAVQAARVMGWL